MSAETDIDPRIGGEHRSRRLAALAERQHGFVAARQLLAMGFGRRSIENRVRAGELHVWYRGVYAVGHRAVKREGRWMAAVLAVGPGAVLSHRTAAALWGIRPTGRSAVEVTVDRKVRSRGGIEVHQARLERDEVTRVDGIPVTSAARTLVDLAAVLPGREVHRAVRQAQILRLPYPDLDRYKGRRGIANLPRADPPRTRSDLEDDFLAFLDAHGLPRPAVNAGIHGVEPDVRWTRERVIVELDGFETHGTRQAFEDDRARDRRLLTAGWRVVRVTWRQLHEQPAALAADLCALLRPAA